MAKSAQTAQFNFKSLRESMKLLRICLLILIGASAVLATEDRITRAKNATEGQFPYQIGLYLNGTNPHIDWCGGSLIGIEWVLTAAHCLENVRSVIVYLGSTIRRVGEQTRFVSKKDFIVHHAYNGEIFTNDIALIKMPAVALSPKVQIIKLPSILNRMHSNYKNKYAIASGWGRTSDADPFVTNRLQWAQFRIISSEVCYRAYRPITRSALCLASEGGVSPCNGDSGGPLVLNGTLIGSFSFLALRGCELNLPVGYVPLTNYLDWIYKHTGIFY